MTKKNLIAAALIALAASAPAMANPYLDIAAGKSKLGSSCDGLTQCDRSGSAFKIAAGYQLNDAWDIQLANINFGKFKAVDGGTTIIPKVQSTAFTAGFTNKFGNLDLIARLGLSSTRLKIDGTVTGVGSTTLKETTTQPHWGLGLNYNISKTVAFGASFDSTRAELDGEKENVSAFFVGARINF